MATFRALLHVIHSICFRIYYTVTFRVILGGPTFVFPSHQWYQVLLKPSLVCDPFSVLICNNLGHLSFTVLPIQLSRIHVTKLMWPAYWINWGLLVSYIYVNSITIYKNDLFAFCILLLKTSSLPSCLLMFTPRICVFLDFLRFLGIDVILRWYLLLILKFCSFILFPVLVTNEIIVVVFIYIC